MFFGQRNLEYRPSQPPKLCPFICAPYCHVLLHGFTTLSADNHMGKEAAELKCLLNFLLKSCKYSGCYLVLPHQQFHIRPIGYWIHLVKLSPKKKSLSHQTNAEMSSLYNKYCSLIFTSEANKNSLILNDICMIVPLLLLIHRQNSDSGSSLAWTKLIIEMAIWHQLSGLKARHFLVQYVEVKWTWQVDVFHTEKWKYLIVSPLWNRYCKRLMK